MRKEKIIYWITTGLLFLFEGVMPVGTLLFAREYATLGTKPLGYPDYFAYSLIICKGLGAMALVLPKLNSKIKEWAYAGFSFNLIFAVISHSVVDKEIVNIIMPMVVGIVLVVSYIYNSKLSKSN